MSGKIYTVGDSVRCTGTLKTSTGVKEDTTGAVTFKVKSPAGVVTTYLYGTDAELVRSAEGVYYVEVDAASWGVWYYGFVSTGSAQAAQESWFEARRGDVFA